MTLSTQTSLPATPARRPGLVTYGVAILVVACLPALMLASLI